MPDLISSLPMGHLYAWIDRAFLSQGQRKGFERCSWFGLTSIPGRAWGLQVLTESGAVYSTCPPHALAFSDTPCAEWTLEQSQRWDLPGEHFACTVYSQLEGRDVDAYVRGAWVRSRYLFTARHSGDAYSREPEQAKEYHFLRTYHDRLTILPGNCCLFHDTAFTKVRDKPDWLRVQTDVYACESAEPWDKTIGEDTA